MYLARLSTADGSCKWLVRPDTGYSTQGFDISIDLNEDIVVANHYDGLVLSSWDSLGVFHWTRRITRSTTSDPNIAHDAQGHVYVFSTFSDSIVTHLGTFHATGLYDNFVCKLDSNLELMDPVGIKEDIREKEEFQFQVFPNPSTGWFNVEILSKLETNCYLSLTDVMGRLVIGREIKISEESKTIKVSTNGLVGGIYFLTLTVDGSRSHQKLVVY